MDAQLILHPTDGSEGARRALDYAADLARDKRSRLLVLHVQQRHGRPLISTEMKEFERIEQLRVTEAEVLRQKAEDLVAEAARAASAKGAPNVETMVVEGDPAGEIIEAAKVQQANMIVMGNRGLGDLQGLLLGSVSHKVAHLAPCTCVIVR